MDTACSLKTGPNLPARTLHSIEHAHVRAHALWSPPCCWNQEQQNQIHAELFNPTCSNPGEQFKTHSVLSLSHFVMLQDVAYIRNYSCEKDSRSPSKLLQPQILNITFTYNTTVHQTELRAFWVPYTVRLKCIIIPVSHTSCNIARVSSIISLKSRGSHP